LTLPTFLGIGVPRGGTTWLHGLLATHPDVFMPGRRKELNYFNLHHTRGLGWYRKFFPSEEEANRYRAVGEISPWYFYTEGCAERIAELGIGKLVLMLRNPVERTWSYYARAIRDGDFRGSFEAFLDDPRCLALEQGRYTPYLERFRTRFADDRMLVLISEQAFADVEGTQRRLGAFLDVDPARFGPTAGAEPANASFVPRAPRAYALAFQAGRYLRRRQDLDWVVNAGRRLGLKRLLAGRGDKLPPMQPETRRRLEADFRPDILRLEGMLGISLAGWR
jgi:hypothetical protein